MWTFGKLYSLDVSRNELRSAPTGLDAMTELTTLNLSHNELEMLPFELVALAGEHSLETLHVEQNQRLVAPPIDVCVRGIGHIMTWLKENQAALLNVSSSSLDLSYAVTSPPPADSSRKRPSAAEIATPATAARANIDSGADASPSLPMASSTPGSESADKEPRRTDSNASEAVRKAIQLEKKIQEKKRAEQQKAAADSGNPFAMFAAAKKAAPTSPNAPVTTAVPAEKKVMTTTLDAREARKAAARTRQLAAKAKRDAANEASAEAIQAEAMKAATAQRASEETEATLVQNLKHYYYSILNNLYYVFSAPCYPTRCPYLVSMLM